MALAGSWRRLRDPDEERSWGRPLPALFLGRSVVVAQPDGAPSRDRDAALRRLRRARVGAAPSLTTDRSSPVASLLAMPAGVLLDQDRARAARPWAMLALTARRASSPRIVGPLGRRRTATGPGSVALERSALGRRVVWALTGHGVDRGCARPADGALAQLASTSDGIVSVGHLLVGADPSSRVWAERRRDNETGFVPLPWAAHGRRGRRCAHAPPADSTGALERSAGAGLAELVLRCSTASPPTQAVAAAVEALGAARQSAPVVGPPARLRNSAGAAPRRRDLRAPRGGHLRRRPGARRSRPARRVQPGERRRQRHRRADGRPARGSTTRSRRT